ncbi:MAG: hypothetical protein ACRCZM_09090 [Bacteroidales bacterium]
MAKKDSVNLTYDALWFKIFMDSGDMSFYGKEAFITKGLSGREDTFLQLLGNLGCYARLSSFEKDITILIISDSMMVQYLNGYKDPFIQEVEDKINGSNTPYRKLKFITEAGVLEHMRIRANGRTTQNKKDLKDENISDSLRERINQSIEKDQLLLDMIKRYKESSKEPIQQRLF